MYGDAGVEGARVNIENRYSERGRIMSNRNNAESISGYENMDAKDQSYFNKFYDQVDDQAELIAEQHNIDPESQADELDNLLDTLNTNLGEYIVEGAPLTCSMKTLKAQTLLYQNNEMISKPTNLKEMSMLRIPKKRNESFDGLTPANIEDSKGGLRDASVAEKGDEGLNIVSFGNCMQIEDHESLERLAEQICARQKHIRNTKTSKEILGAMKSAIEQGKGTCYCCMMLNPVWENLPMNYDYAENSYNPSLMPQGGVGSVLSSNSYMKYDGKEGINMMSMIFCMRGGIINALDSGQIYMYPKIIRISPVIEKVSDQLTMLLKSYETGEDLSGNLLNEGEPALQTYHGGSDASYVHTIGWGHAMFSIDDGEFTFSNKKTVNLYALGTSITLEEAEEIFCYDVEKRQKELNEILDEKGIREQVNQQFYDALFLLLYQVGIEEAKGTTDLSSFLDSNNFDPDNQQEIMEQFGEYTDNLNVGTMRRRTDELDIIFYNNYNRGYDQTRYGDIWRKKTFPGVVTPGY